MDVINVFISSSFHEDFSLGFKKEREALKSVMAKNRYLKDISLDYGDPQIRGSVDESLARVKDAHLIILFIGTRYGGIVEGEEISLTHLEYRKAIEWDIPVLVYTFPNDPDHEAYAQTAQFIKEIERNNKQIYTDAMSLLSAKHQHTISGYKAGFIPISTEAEHEIELYAEALSLQIVSKISEELQKIQTKLPYGIQEIKENKEEKLRYKQYLSNEKLPYISRTAYKDEYNLDEKFQSENDFYNDVFHGEYDGILISGEGGVGKTRLMFELGRKAQKNGWITYQVYSDFEGWKALKLKENKKYCFLFDYVEENEYFNDNIFDILTREYPGVEIKVVANARSAYLLHNDHDSPLLNKVDLSENKENEIGYIQYVVKKIFEYEKIDLSASGISIEELATKPSFAVFLLQGILKGQKIDFHDIEGFSSYIMKRLSLTLTPKDPSFTKLDSNIFKFLCSLPIKEESIPVEFTEHTLLLLEQDGWIEFDEESEIFKSAYNDTIMDEILISYLTKQSFKNNDRVLKKELNEILDFATENSKFEHAFRAFDRVFEKSILVNKQNLLQNIFENNLYQIGKISNIFIKSSMLPNIEKLRIISSLENFNYTSNDFTHMLLKLMKNDNLDIINIDLIEKIFIKWLSNKDNLDKYSEYHEGSFLIPSYYAFKDKMKSNYLDISTISLGWIRKFYLSPVSNFVMLAYLKYEKDIEDISDEVYAWMTKYGVRKSSFLLSAYFYHPLTNVTSQIKYYTEEYITTRKNWRDEEYTFIVPPYIQKIEIIKNIDDTVTEWINKNIDNEKFVFIISEYLKKVKSTERIDDAVTEWINKNIDNEKFVFIIREYLKKVKSTESIDDAVTEWINKSIDNEKFYYVASEYLKKVKSTERIDDAVTEWLNKSLDNDIFDFVATAYLKKVKSTERIDDTVTEWLKRHIDSDKFDFVATAYLTKVKSTKCIDDTVIEWLNKSIDNDVFQFVATPYLIKVKSTERIDDTVTEWINKSIDNEKFYYVASEYLKKVKSTERIDDTVIEWINKSIDNEKFYYVASEYLKRVKSTERIDDTVIEWINKSIDNEKFYFVASEYLKKVKSTKRIDNTIIGWLNKSINNEKFNFVAYEYLKKVKSTERIDNTIIEWINKSIDNNNFSFLLYEYLKKVKSTERIDNTIIEWLNKSIDNNNFNFILYEYLKKVKSTEDIDDAIVEWLNRNNKNKQFNFVATGYLKKVKSTERIDDALTEWLNRHINNNKFNFVASVYLKKVKSTERIDDTVTEWLHKNIENDKFSFVASEYLKKVKSTERIDDTVTEWLHKNIENNKFSFVASVYLKKVQSMERIDDIIIDWLNKNYTHDNFRYIVVRRYLPRGGDFYKIQHGVKKYLDLDKEKYKEIEVLIEDYKERKKPNLDSLLPLIDYLKEYNIT